MKNILQDTGAFLGKKFALIEELFATKVELQQHTNDAGKHPTPEQIGDDIDEKIREHNQNGAAHDDIRLALSEHMDDAGIHKTSEQMRSEITEGDIPDSIARDTEVDTKISNHNIDTTAHRDIRSSLRNHIISGDIHQTPEQINSSIDTKVSDHNTDASAHPSLLSDIGLIRDMLKSGGTLAEVKEALINLGNNYSNLYVVANTLKSFLEANDVADTTINTWKEIEAFLHGITDSESLSALLSNLETNVKQWADNKFLTTTGDTKDAVVTFTGAAERVNIESGENHAILFGKIKKWFASLGDLAFKDGIEPLRVEFENGVPVEYNGINSQTIFIPGTGGIRVLPKGVNIHGFWEVDKNQMFQFIPILIGLSKENIDGSADFSKYTYNDINKEWTVLEGESINDPFIKSIIAINITETGYYKWTFFYTDPVTRDSKMLESEYIYLYVVDRNKKDIVPVDPFHFAEGYKIKYDTLLSEQAAQLAFKMYGFTENAIVKTYESVVNGTWNEVDPEPSSLSAPYIMCYFDKPGKYKITVSEGEEEVSKEFNVIKPEQEICECCKIYVVSEYPTDLSIYPEGTTFIKE